MRAAGMAEVDRAKADGRWDAAYASSSAIEVPEDLAAALAAEPRAAAMFDAIANHKVTHLCGAPIVMSTLLNAAANEKKPLPHVVEFFTAAAPPPAAVLAAMKQAGFNVTHLYGLTECYGPAVVNDWHSEWDALPLGEQAETFAGARLDQSATAE